MSRWVAGFLMAFVALAYTAPSYAASRFTAIRYVRIGIRLAETGQSITGQTPLAPEAALLTSADDRNWQFTASNCVFDIDMDETKLTADDQGYLKGYKRGFGEADNPNQDVLEFVGKAVGARQIGDGASQSLVCDARRVYWFSVVRAPKAPGAVVVTLMSMDGYRLQDTEQMVAIFKPDVFLKGQTQTAAEIGGVTAAIARAMAQ